MRELAVALACLSGTLMSVGAATATLIVGINDDAKYESSVPAFFMPTMKAEGLKLNALTIRWDETAPTTIPADQQASIRSLIRFDPRRRPHSSA